MNAVFGYATLSPDLELSPFALGVHEAFDAGEFRGSWLLEIQSRQSCGKASLYVAMVRQRHDYLRIYPRKNR